MLSSEEYNDKIDSFLKGKLNQSEADKLQEGFLSNNKLKNEFDLQKDIISTIQANRKAELKARLNNIDVSASSFNWWKYAALLGVVATISTLIYVGSTIGNQPSTAIINTDKKTEVVVNSEVTDRQKPVESLGNNNSKIGSTKKVEDEIDTKTAPIASNNKKANKKVETNSSVELVPREEATPNLPNVHTPEAQIHEHIAKEVETPDHSLTNSKHINTTVAGVEVVKSKKHKFHYRYFDNKLFLYGDFDAKTYDILELNTNKGQKLYLKFESNYYELRSNRTEISKLEQVKDKTTLKELEEIQKK